MADLLPTMLTVNSIICELEYTTKENFICSLNDLLEEHTINNYSLHALYYSINNPNIIIIIFLKVK
jgi:hypothetical protein